MVHTVDDLRQYQALPMSTKALMSKNRIRKWVNEFGIDETVVLMTFSPESAVLLHMTLELYPNINVAFDYLEGMKPITAWMVGENEANMQTWLELGCNHFETERPESNPMAFWLKEDVFQYIKERI